MKSNFFKSALLATTALSLGLGIPAIAAADEPEEIIVTARRMNERLQDVPISITVFDQQQLDNRNISTASDLAAYTPSLSTDKRFGPDNSSFSIRGFTQELRTSPSVGVYFADVVAPRGGGIGTTSGEGAGPGAFFDLQNVQILKGPQGTLFGRNTTGGAVLLVPNKPTSELGGYVEGSYGNYDMRRFQAVVNIPINDKIRFRGGFDRMLRDGYLENISNVGPSKFADVDYYAGRGGLDVDITPEINNYTVFNYSNSDNNGAPPQVFACGSVKNPNPDTDVGIYNGLGVACPQVARLQGHDYWTVDNGYANPRSFVEQLQVINTTTWLANDYLTVKNIASYSQFKNILNGNVLGDNFHVPATNALGLPIDPSFVGLPLTVTNSTAQANGYSNAQQNFTEELQLQGKSGDDKLVWQVGGYMELSDPYHPSGSISSNNVYCPDPTVLLCSDTINPPALGAVDGGVQISQGTITYRNLGVYGQGTYALTNKLKLTAGIRYTFDTTEATVQQIVFDFLPASATPSIPSTIKCANGFAELSENCTKHFRQTSTRPTWVLDLEYAPTRDLMTYVKYARGYRQGGVSPFSPGGVNMYGPETVNAYEIGVKTGFHGRVPGIVNFAVFYNDFSNQQIQVGYTADVFGGAPPFTLDNSSTTAILNAGKSRIFGAEIESTLNLLESFRLDMSASYLDSKLESMVLPAAAPGFIITPTAQEGGALPLTPRYKATITGTYTLPLPETIGRVSIAATYTYTDKMIVNGSDYRYTDRTNLVNLNLNWGSIGGGPVDAALFVTNLLNESYSVHSAGLLGPYGYETRNLGEPRMYGLRVRLRYGD